MRRLSCTIVASLLVMVGGLTPLCGHAQIGGFKLEEVPAQTNLEQSPLWEIGVGAGGTNTPDYPGSDQNHTWAIPFPFGIYRGEIVHSDRWGGTRARFFRTVGYEFNVSAGGGLPSSSNRNDARAAMPNLEWLGEIGPRLMFDVLSFSENRLLRVGLPRFHDLGRIFFDRFHRRTDGSNAWSLANDLEQLVTVFERRTKRVESPVSLPTHQFR